MEIKPHKNLLVKQWLTLLVISLVIIIVAAILQLLIPLKDGVNPSQVAAILWPITIGTILLMWIISVPIIILWIRNLAYHIEDDKITIFKGILTKRQQNIPYRAITDFMLNRSLFDRFLKIASIRIQTAGQSHSATGYEGNLSGLDRFEDLYEQLRSHLKKIHERRDSIAVTDDTRILSNQGIENQILEELKAIRKVLENKD
jgi:uncharacterized membrane protein YdbT with pleckstrin-like domain